MQMQKISNAAEKEELYKEIVPQIKGIISNEPNLIANLANIAAILKAAHNFFWVGFYLENDGELVLGPFQGPLACTRIPKGKGVCGTAWKDERTLIVPNVHDFKGHIACNANSKSEIVVPFKLKDNRTVVLDVDSTLLNDFTVIDQQYLEEIVTIIKDNH